MVIKRYNKIPNPKFWSFVWINVLWILQGINGNTTFILVLGGCNYNFWQIELKIDS